LLIEKRRKLPARLQNIAVFTAISAGPILAWLWRNHSVSSTLTGGRVEGSPFTLGQNLALTGDLLSAWFLPNGSPPGLGLAGLGLVVGLSAVFLGWLGRSERRPRLTVSHPLCCLGGFLLFYSGWLLATASTIAIG